MFVCVQRIEAMLTIRGMLIAVVMSTTITLGMRIGFLRLLIYLIEILHVV